MSVAHEKKKKKQGEVVGGEKREGKGRHDWRLGRADGESVRGGVRGRDSAAGGERIWADECIGPGMHDWLAMARNDDPC